MTVEPKQRGRLVAIFTGAISIIVGLLYLAMIVLLDSRGPLQPPPPEALGLLSQPTSLSLTAADQAPGLGGS